MNNKREERLAHILKHLEHGFDVAGMVSNVERGVGNRRACLMGLSSHALANAMLAWFANTDLGATKQWCYVAAQLDKNDYETEADTSGPGAKLLQLLKPLVSGNKELIDWFANYDACYDNKKIEDSRTHDFWAYQAIVALRGDWERLGRRCKFLAENLPGAAAEQKYLLDYDFYRALAHKDVSGMQTALNAIASPKIVKSRAKDESGFTQDLIFTPAVIYAKIAWHHGFEVLVDSPLVPAEWLPEDSLQVYDSKYSFLK